MPFLCYPVKRQAVFSPQILSFQNCVDVYRHCRALCLGRHSGLNSLLCCKPASGVEFILILLPSLVLARLIHLDGSETSALSADGYSPYQKRIPEQDVLLCPCLVLTFPVGSTEAVKMLVDSSSSALQMFRVGFLLSHR